MHSRREKGDGHEKEQAPGGLRSGARARGNGRGARCAGRRRLGARLSRLDRREEAQIRAAIDRLSRRGWARLASGPGSRVAKYRHLLDEALDLVPSQLSLIAVLLLRGAQTPGELKARGERLYPFGTLMDIHRALEELIDRELVERLQRRPGQKEERYRHLLGGADAPEAAVTSLPEPADDRVGALEARIAALEEQVAELQRALEAR